MRALQKKGSARPRRTQQERRETTRRLLIEAAIDRICELGFAGATLELITERAGVTRGAVQHHFRTRDELLLAIVNELNEKLNSLSEVPVVTGGSLSRRLESICDQLWEVASSRHFMAAIQIQLGTVTDPILSPQVRKIMVKIEEDMDNGWIEMFANDGIAPARITAARHLAQAALRGLAVKQIYRKKLDDSEQERELLVHMLRYAFRTGS